MNTIRELKQKGQELKQRIEKFGAPHGNKNAAGPHDGIPGNNSNVTKQARANLITTIQVKLKGATLQQMRSGDHDIMQNGIRVGRVTGTSKEQFSAQVGDAFSVLSRTPQEALNNLRAGKLYGVK